MLQVYRLLRWEYTNSRYNFYLPFTLISGFFYCQVNKLEGYLILNKQMQVYTIIPKISKNRLPTNETAYYKISINTLEKSY